MQNGTQIAQIWSKDKGEAWKGPGDTSVKFQEGGGGSDHTCYIPNESGEKGTRENATLTPGKA